MSEICVLYWVARQLFGFSIESLSYIMVGDYWNTSQFHFRQSQFTPSSNVETSNVEQLTVVRDSIKLLQWHSASSSHSLVLKHWVWTRIHKRAIDRLMHTAHKHAKCRLKSLIPVWLTWLLHNGLYAHYNLSAERVSDTIFSHSKLW